MGFQALTTVLQLLTVLPVVSAITDWYGHNYWNDRHGDEGIAYQNERFYLWSSHQDVKEGYFYNNDFYNEQVCSGCSCRKELIGCSGTKIVVKGQSVEKITEKSFSSSVQEIHLIDMPSLVEVENITFYKTRNLRILHIHGTGITIVPDVSQTAMTDLYLVNNKIRFFPHNYTKQVLPNSLKKVSLIGNRIEWFPDEFVSKTNIEVLALSRNNIRQFPGSGLKQMPKLWFLSLDDNVLEVVSREHLTHLAASPLIHLNMSNNAIWYIEPSALSQARSLKILELHNNAFTEITEGTFSNIPELVHLDLVKNKIEVLTARSITNLPKIVTIRLHSQDPPMNNIQYNAFQNIQNTLENLWISDNELKAFPHPALSEQTYIKINEIYADHNLIEDPTEYSPDDFPKSMRNTALLRAASHIPFSRLEPLNLLHLGANVIDFIQPGYFCNLKDLYYLYLNTNGLKDDGIPDTAFSCMGQLRELYLYENYLTYVPEAVTSDNLTNLQLLRLSSNNITHIESGTFIKLTSLQELWMENNLIIVIENGSFPNSVTQLVLQSNNFRFTNENPFMDLSNLNFLYLGYNSITDIPDTAFKGCSALTLLELQYNKLERIQNGLLSDCPLSTRLLLNNNILRYVEHGALSHITKTVQIHLHENRLTELPNGGDFNNLEVTELYIHKNRITEVRPGTFSNLTCHDRLDLADNQIAVLGPDSFVNIDGTPDFYLNNNLLWTVESFAFRKLKVRDLYIQYTKINHLKTSTFDTIELRYLYLTNNQIDYMEEGVFAGANVLEYFIMNTVGLKAIYGKMFSAASQVTKALDLRNNELEMVPPDLVENVQLLQANLANNKLTNFPRDIFLENKMTSMDISHNKITALPDDAFDGLTNMYEIILKGNQITEIKNGSFSSLINCEKVDFAENKLVTWPKGLMDPMDNLKILDLSKNLLYHFPAVKNGSTLAQVILKDNLLTSIEVGAFDTLNATLVKLDLTDNDDFECTCDLFRTLREVYTVISGGTCGKPGPTTGIPLGIEKEDESNFFMKADKEVYVCAPTDVSGKVTGTSLNVTWTRPLYLNSETEKEGKLLKNGTTVTYNVSCTGSSGDVLSSTVNDTTFAVLTVKDDSEYVCVVTVGAKGKVSGFSEPAVFQTTPAAVVPDNNTVVAVGLHLPISYYDFSAVHPDFAGLSTAIIAEPTYIPSPYGAWLAQSNNPATDSFSDWFLSKPGINEERSENITLENLSTSPPVYRYSAGSFFPLDDFGYGNEQKDCGGTTHNFGFTSVIRMGIVYQGTEVITVGGGDDMWLYINGKMVIYIASRGTNTFTCKKIDLSPAAAIGGAKITPIQGSVSASTCTGSTALTSEAIHLDLEVGERYHFAVFHAERLLCSSNFFMELSDVHFITTPGEDPPMDYFVTIDEDFYVDGILQSLVLSDAFSVGPPFKINVLQGNEARHFTVKSDTKANQPTAPTAPSYTYTTIGNISFVECSTLSAIAGDTTDTSAETYDITTATALFALATSVDYEFKDMYTVALEVVDPGKTPGQTGTIGIKIHIRDVNDNCPEFDQSAFNIWANPALQSTSIATLNASDIDSGNNTVLRYYRSDILATPEVSYNESEDLHKSVYTKNTTLSFTVFVVDQGEPVRGATGTVSMVVDNSCLVSVEFEPIIFDYPLDEITGEISFVVPGYYHYEFECLRIMGIEKAFIQDQYLTASSAKEKSGPERARLNMTTLSATLGSLTGGWVADIDDANQWIQTELDEPYVIRVVQLQGRDDEVNYVTSFSVFVSDDGTTFTKYTNGAGSDVLQGSTDQNTVVDVMLEPPARGSFIRINPQTWVGHVSLRFELLGCSQREELHYQTSCERCETTWYCPGDGTMLPCGRCDPPMSNSTCGRSPTEHSFGLASECTWCPLGWICKNGYAEPCEEFHYVTYCNDTYCPASCSPCEPGYACRGGQRYYCGIGTWSDGKKEFCELCQPGTYQDVPGQTECKPCEKGYRSTTMKDRCESCNPKSWSKGDGTDCEACSGPTQCPCMGTTPLCFKGVTCRNAQATDGSFTHICDDCPVGYRGDGVTCTDIDECYEHSPCWNSSACKNTEPGYQCHRCPIGFTGSNEDALAYNVTGRNFVDCNQKHDPSPFQHCEDTDECLENNGGCDPNAYCHNTVGSFYCGLCKPGYVGSSKYGCDLADFCVSGKHLCGINSTCYFAGPGDYSCHCNNGLAGNGFTCGPDVDLDGFPSEGISCNGEEFGRCKKDNCPDISNSGQEDNDGDQMGDSCDNDDDNDTVFDLSDNCPMVFNNKQEDGDGDGIGDACDNCPGDKNADQADADGDGLGDACQADSDSDGRSDAIDNCPLVANNDQANADGDNWGDVCDNCPTDANNGQDDLDQNGVGDVCEGNDRDGDSIPDSKDNCPDMPNAEQRDTDGDGNGDYCDDDSDDDGVPDSYDNCMYTSNPGQEDVDGNHRGDACELDLDQDGTKDRVDNCMENKFINFTSFFGYTTVEFYPDWTAQADPDWRVLDQGREVRQEATTRRPIALIGPQALDHMDFDGTTFVEDKDCAGFIGFIFGFHSAKKFYLMTWRHNYKNFGYYGGMKGVQIRVIDSSVNVGQSFAQSLYNGGDITGVTKVIWHDPSLRGWECNIAYRWHIEHRPSLGYMSVEIKQEEEVVVSSGRVYDSTILGGRLGVFVYDQKGPIWSRLRYQCKTRLNYALLLDGVDDYAEVGTLDSLGVEKSFTVEALIKLPTGYSSGKHPILCTNNSVLCLYVEANKLQAKVKDTVITGTSTIPANTWTHTALRYNAQLRELDLIVNGPKNAPETQLTGVEPNLVWDGNETMYLGYDGSNYLQAEVDEIRIYNIQLVELNEITETLYLHEEPNRYLLGVHYNMDEATNSSLTLKDYGYKGQDAQLLGDPSIVTSSSDQKIFDLTYN